MDAAITVLVVILSLLLVLGIAAYAFRMIQDSLPGNAGPDQSYPNPLNWLNNNSASNKTSTTVRQKPGFTPRVSTGAPRDFGSRAAGRTESIHSFWLERPGLGLILHPGCRAAINPVR